MEKLLYIAGERLEADARVLMGAPSPSWTTVVPVEVLGHQRLYPSGAIQYYVKPLVGDQLPLFVWAQALRRKETR